MANGESRVNAGGPTGRTREAPGGAAEDGGTRSTAGVHGDGSAGAEDGASVSGPTTAVPPAASAAVTVAEDEEATGTEAGDEPEPPARVNAKAQLLARWQSFPPHSMAAMDRLIDDGLARAAQAEPEVLTVMNPVSRPVRLRLAPIAADADLDRMYHRASAELSLSVDGRCYLVYRQRDGGDYAVLWSAATSLPEALLARLPDPLATALLETDTDDA